MNEYKFVKVSSYYRQFLKDYYAKNPDEKNKPYDLQLSGLLKQAIGWSDFYSKRLNELGADATELIFNAQPLQAQWAREHNCGLIGKGIILEQIALIKPEVVMFQDCLTFNGEWIETLREKVPSIKLIIGWCCSPLPEKFWGGLKAFDFIFVCTPKLKNDFTKAGLKNHQFYHAFEDSLLPLLDENNSFDETDFIFTGSVIPGTGFHDMRIKVLEDLINSGIDISIYANIPVLSQRDLFLRRSAYIVAKSLSAVKLENVALKIPRICKAVYLESLPSNINSVITNIAKPPLFGIDMLKALHKSKIGFNNHIEATGEHAANIRLFEVTGTGSCLVTDNKSNIRDLFEPDKEIITYDSPQECIEKVKWLLEHPAERAAIAKAGQKRTLATHTIKQRAEFMHETILKELRNKL